MPQQRYRSARTQETGLNVPTEAAVATNLTVGRSAIYPGVVLAVMMYFGAIFSSSGSVADWESAYLAAGSGIGIAIGALALWWLHRASAGKSSRAIAIALTVLVFPGFILADSPVAFGILWIAVLALCFEVHVSVSYILAGLLGSIGFAVHIYTGSSPLRALSESATILFAVGLGMYIAILLKRINRSEAERSRALSELEIANQELRNRLVTEQDLVVAEERARLAAALHDGLGHRLTSISMSLDFSERIVSSDLSRAREEMRQARTTASQALDEMRRAVRAMHPVAIEAQDPLGSIRELAASFHSTGLQVRFLQSGSGTVSPEAGLLILRFVQEALTNVVRHSAATLAQLSVTIDDDASVVVRLQDNGTGGEVAGGYGIPSLKERAAARGGSVTAQPHGGISGGFMIELRLPGAVQ